MESRLKLVCQILRRKNTQIFVWDSKKFLGHFRSLDSDFVQKDFIVDCSFALSEDRRLDSQKSLHFVQLSGFRQFLLGSERELSLAVEVGEEEGERGSQQS